MKTNPREIATARILGRISSTTEQRPALALPSCFQLPNLLAIDAALFALCWQFLVFQAFGLEGLWTQGALVAIAVWLGYTADRWLDVRGMQNAPSTHRHKFAAKHRKGLFVAWVTILGLCLGLAWRTLSSDDFGAGLVLAGLCGTNAWLNHVDSKGCFLVPKEMRAALLLSAGIHLFLWRSLPALTFSFWLSFVMVTLLCFLNCCFVATWEKRVDHQQGQSSLALRRKQLGNVAKKVTFATIALCIAMVLLRKNEPEGLMLLATVMALLPLPVINHWRLDPEDKRVLADAALFLPCILLA
jgi:hypothetical protein